MAEPDLSVVVLAYEEEVRLGRTLDRLADFLSQKDYGGVEVLMVCAAKPDGTRDASLDIAVSKAGRFDSLQVVDTGPKQGKGHDARLGMLRAQGRYRIFMDADLATPLHHLDDALSLAQSAAVVIAVRDLTSTHKGLRKWISTLGNLLIQAVLLPGIGDTQCGFKMFRADAAEQIFSRQIVEGWGFDMEILAIARKLGYPIATLPVSDWSDVEGGSFENVAVAGALDTLKDLFTIKRRILNGAYSSKNYQIEQSRHSVTDPSVTGPSTIGQSL